MKGNANKQFLYTAIGAAFGLGNVARFPALCLSYGGAFVAAYVAVLALVGFPMLAVELTLGRRHASAFPLKAVCPLGGAVGGLSALNSAAMCAVYGVIISVFALRACTFHASVNYGCPADIIGVTPLFAVIVFIALAFFLTRRQCVRALAARAAVLFQAGLLAVLAVRGLTYSNALSTLASVFALNGALIISGEVWLAALGQALLSLSVAAGVMPAFAAQMPRSLSPVRAAAAITLANLLGGLLAATATITLAGGGGVLGLVGGSAFGNALSLYPAALRAAFSNGHICGLFGCAFYLSLTLTAFVSALSLARPAYVWVQAAGASPRAAACTVCAAMLAFCLPFAFGLSFAAVDELCCNVVAPVAAVGEVACFAFYALTERKRSGKIKVWKTFLNS